LLSKQSTNVLIEGIPDCCAVKGNKSNTIGNFRDNQVIIIGLHSETLFHLCCVALTVNQDNWLVKFEDIIGVTDW